MDRSHIINYAYGAIDNTISMDDLDNNFGHLYYCNGRFHLRMMMTRMVKNGIFTRIKKGVYKLNLSPVNKKSNKPQVIDPKQTSLF